MYSLCEHKIAHAARGPTLFLAAVPYRTRARTIPVPSCVADMWVVCMKVISATGQQPLVQSCHWYLYSRYNQQQLQDVFYSPSDFPKLVCSINVIIDTTQLGVAELAGAEAWWMDCEPVGAESICCRSCLTTHD